MRRTLFPPAAATAIAGAGLEGSAPGDLRHFNSAEVARRPPCGPFLPCGNVAAAVRPTVPSVACHRVSCGSGRLPLQNAQAAKARRQQRGTRRGWGTVASPLCAGSSKQGNTCAAYEKALPELRSCYAVILSPAADTDRSARLKLEWWVVHRERATVPAGSLDKSRAELQAELYRMPVAVFAEHARLRAEAMLLRDRKAQEGAVTDADWSRIGQLLDRSWGSLARAVR